MTQLSNVDTQAEAAQEIAEYYFQQQWTDGLPVVPVTEDILATFLQTTPKDSDEVLFHIPHLNRSMTVRLAAINAAMAGCKPEYFPAVVAAWEAIALEPHPARGIWQSTTGTAPFLIVNGPIRDRISLNSQGNIYGSGIRPNATIGRAIRLGLVNVFGLHPHSLDQATQGNPSKYSACFAENEDRSPWEPFHVEHGFNADDDVVTAFVIRSVLHIEARHTGKPEQLAEDLADSVRRTGALIHEFTSALLVLVPEHAELFANAGWSKEDVRQEVAKRVVRSRADLVASGKDALSNKTRWRIPGEHPDSMPDILTSEGREEEDVPLLYTPQSIQVMVAGADNAGVSSVVEIFTLNPPRELPFSSVKVEAVV